MGLEKFPAFKFREFYDELEEHRERLCRAEEKIAGLQEGARQPEIDNIISTSDPKRSGQLKEMEQKILAIFRVRYLLEAIERGSTREKYSLQIPLSQWEEITLEGIKKKFDAERKILENRRIGKGGISAEFWKKIDALFTFLGLGKSTAGVKSAKPMRNIYENLFSQMEKKENKKPIAPDSPVKLKK